MSGILKSNPSDAWWRASVATDVQEQSLSQLAVVGRELWRHEDSTAHKQTVGEWNGNISRGKRTLRVGPASVENPERTLMVISLSDRELNIISAGGAWGVGMKSIFKLG